MKNQILAFVFMAAILLAIATMLFVIITLEHSAEDADKGEHLSHLTTENFLSLNALEWQAVANQHIDPIIMMTVEEHRTAIDESLAELITLYPDEKSFSNMQSDFEKYKEATDEEFGLIAAGRVTDALAIDEEKVDPLFDRLTDTTTVASNTMHEKAVSSESLSFYLTIVSSLLTVLVTVILLMLYTNTQQRNRQMRMEKAVLAVSEERFRSVAESANEAIITINAQSKVTYWNKAATRIFGYEADQAIGKPVSFIMPARYHDEHKSAMKRFNTEGEETIIGKTVEFSGLKKDGSEFPIELSLSHWQAQQGIFFTAIIHDISARKQIEQQMADQGKALEQRAIQLSTLFEVGSTISGTIELKRLLDHALKSIINSEVLEVQHKAGILLENENRLTLVSHVGHTDEFLSLHKDIQPGECLCGLAFESGEILVSTESDLDDRHTIRYPGMQPHGHVIVPLKAMDKVVGVLYLYTIPGTVVDDEKKKLFATIGGQLGIAIENARLFEKTKELSLHDQLTGLANRNFMNIELRKTLAMARRTKRPLSLIMLDLDHFKKYNDTYGHPAGDKLLADVAAIIVSIMRETDMVVRYGGEEFLMILPETNSPSAALIAERIRTTIMQTGFMYADNDLPNHITVSQGVTTFDKSMEVEEEGRLIVMADEALYQAKDLGRNRIEIYRQDNKKAAS
ncbi:MAG: diguanylate cyclase [Actinobacteria bacterium]|nr:diguanylate cyclase [Actinomycetota bacterium]